MKQQATPPASEKKRVWLKTKYANLMRYVPSGCYYARFRARGKLVWKSLETNKVSIARLRLADVLKEHHARAARQVENQGGTMTVGEALQTVLERIQGNPERKPLTKRSSADRIAALKRSWPGLEKLAVQAVTKTDCLDWVESATGKMSPSSFNQIVRHMRRAFALAVELGCRTDNPAAAIEWRREKPKELRLPEPEQHLAELIVSGRMIRLELDHFAELSGGVIQFAPAEEGAAELEAHGIHRRIGVLGLLQFLDGIGILVLPQCRAAEEEGELLPQEGVDAVVVEADRVQ
ncbi:MAG: hypothetical protein EBT61_09570, partial [Verrucomicrobia bacterium]|nr:hypothetical protein [Verrucomicrobiota bacterium]